MAEKLFEKGLSESGSKQNIKVFSAGISAMDGDKASDNSITACKEIGLDLEDHRKLSPNPATAENASAIFCMTESHRVLLHMYFELPEDAPIFLMREFLNQENKELPRSIWTKHRGLPKMPGRDEGIYSIPSSMG